MDFGDVSERVALRKRLQCRSFRWYLEHVYPEMRIYNNTITYGEVRQILANGITGGDALRVHAVINPTKPLWFKENANVDVANLTAWVMSGAARAH